MTDFRSNIYQQYVTLQRRGGAAPGTTRFPWFRNKYLPLLANVPKDTPILELGCGAGEMLSFLESEGFKNARGIDISAEQIALATKRGANAQTANAFEFLEQHRHAFGVILAFDFLEHFSKEELSRLLPSIRDALRPNGLFIGQTPNAAGLFPRQVMFDDLTHLTYLTPRSAEQLFALHGFVDLALYETSPNPIGLTSTARWALWKVTRLACNAMRIIETGKSQNIWTENLIFRCRAM